MKPKYSLDLEICRDELEFLEGEIINKLVDRAQFALNREIYAGETSLLDVWLRRLESPFASLGKFTVAEERPFTAELPPPDRAYPGDLALPDRSFDVNLNGEIQRAYVDFLPRVCSDAQDGHQGSSIEYDFMALRAISKRIHFGAYYVAAAKYQAQPELFRPFVEKEDVDGIEAALTFGKKEEEVVTRIGAKARRIQEAIHPFKPSWRLRVAPDAIADFYRETIIPLTKKGQVLFLLGLGRKAK